MFHQYKDRWVLAQAQPTQASKVLPVRTKTALRKMPKVHTCWLMLSSSDPPALCCASVLPIPEFDIAFFDKLDELVQIL